MNEALALYLQVIITIIGIIVMLGFPLGKVLAVVGKWGLILLAVLVAAPMIPTFVDHLQKNPPQTPQELGVWIVGAAVILLIFLRIVLGAMGVKNFIASFAAAAVYDVIKGLSKTIFLAFVTSSSNS